MVFLMLSVSYVMNIHLSLSTLSVLSHATGVCQRQCHLVVSGSPPPTIGSHSRHPILLRRQAGRTPTSSAVGKAPCDKLLSVDRVSS